MNQLISRTLYFDLDRMRSKSEIIPSKQIEINETLTESASVKIWTLLIVSYTPRRSQYSASQNRTSKMLWDVSRNCSRLPGDCN